MPVIGQATPLDVSGAGPRQVELVMKANQVTSNAGRVWLLTGALLTTACGQSISAKLCERQAECNNLTNQTVDECTESMEAFLESQTEAMRQFLETAYEQCIDVACSEFSECTSRRVTGM
jgi:hypothetical protein